MIKRVFINQFVILLFVLSGCEKKDMVKLTMTAIDTGYYDKGLFIGIQLQYVVDQDYELSMINSEGKSVFYIIYKDDVYYSYSYTDIKTLVLKTEKDPTLYVKFLIKQVPAIEDDAKSLHDQFKLFIGNYPNGKEIYKQDGCHLTYHGKSELL